MPERSLGEWLAHLETLHPNEIELGLERVAAVARNMSLHRPGRTVITVAGTNGKGSTTALLEAMALAAGKSVGLYSSPHFLRYNERVRIGGREVSDSELVAAFEAVEAARGDIPLTYFEYGTLAALRLFADARLEVALLEVGLGGRLDAVNIIDPDVAVITSISLDHEAWLGSDRESIGREKAGILRPGVTAVVADPDPPASVATLVEQLGCTVSWYRDGAVTVPRDSFLRPENLFAAREAAKAAGFAPDEAGLATVLTGLRLPGRLQRARYRDRALVLDVAHNPAAAAHLAGWLETSVTAPRIALFAALSDKDIHAMIRACSGVFDHWYAAGLPGVGRALPPAELARRIAEAGEPGVSAQADVRDAFETIQAAHPEGTVVVFGSFFTVAAMMELLGEGPEQA